MIESSGDLNSEVYLVHRSLMQDTLVTIVSSFAIITSYYGYFNKINQEDQNNYSTVYESNRLIIVGIS